MTENSNKTTSNEAIHKRFSAECFNKVWEFIDKKERSPEEEEEMLRLAMTSHWHWTQRSDYAPDKASVGYWQISRVFALMGQADNARRFAKRSLDVLENVEVDPFFIGYAYEALARAEAVAGDGTATKRYLDVASGIAAKLSDEEMRAMLAADLESIHVD